MDSLLRAMENFRFTPTKNVGDFDEFISKIDSLYTNDADDEWDTVTDIYSKILYLNCLIENYDFPETDMFKQVLSNILDGIDKKNQYYLNELNWDDDELQEELDIIREAFEKSLNQNCSFLRIKYILEAYSVLIPMIEDFRKEKFVDIIEDPEFIQKVESVSKRRKLN